MSAPKSSRKRRRPRQPEPFIATSPVGRLCASCEHYMDDISEHCDGPGYCSFACPHIEPERAAAIAKELKLP